jgi:hypothetical protein
MIRARGMPRPPAPRSARRGNRRHRAARRHSADRPASWPDRPAHASRRPAPRRGAKRRQPRIEGEAATSLTSPAPASSAAARHRGLARVDGDGQADALPRSDAMTGAVRGSPRPRHGSAPGRVLSPPMSRISAPAAPWRRRAKPARRLIRKSPPSEKLSGVTFRMPMIRGRSTPARRWRAGPRSAGARHSAGRSLGRGDPFGPRRATAPRHRSNQPGPPASVSASAGGPDRSSRGGGSSRHSRRAAPGAPDGCGRGRPARRAPRPRRSAAPRSAAKVAGEPGGQRHRVIGAPVGLSTVSSTIFDGAQTQIWPLRMAQSSSVRVSTTLQRGSRAASTQAFCSMASRSIRRCASGWLACGRSSRRAHAEDQRAARPPAAGRSSRQMAGRDGGVGQVDDLADAARHRPPPPDGPAAARTISTPSAPGPRSSFSIRTKARIACGSAGSARPPARPASPAGSAARRPAHGGSPRSPVIGQDAVHIVVDRTFDAGAPRPRC